MSKVVTVEFEWTYIPKNYLEEPIEICGDHYQISISDGVALARIDPSLFTQNENFKEQLTDLIESRFQAVQVMNHSEYTISRPSRTDITSDGKRNIFLEIQPTIMKMTCGNVDLVIKDKDGNVISDTRKERLEKQKWFSEAVSKHRKNNNTLDQMLKSYQAAVGDPGNEFVHLYEVRDALALEFGGKKNALTKLNLTEGEWDAIGELANAKPLKQGRHRGRSVGMLRDAEKNELDMARKSVSKLIEKYLVHLEAK
jgi:hypothetical protein